MKRDPRVVSGRRWASVTAIVIAAGGLWFANAAEDDEQIKVEAAGAAPTAPAPAPTTQAPAEKPVAAETEAAGQVSPARDRLRSGLIGSKHDFTQSGQSGRDLCLPCHTPHVVMAAAPQLDRRPSDVQPLRPYQETGVELDGWSLLCLGCHDGLTAPDVYSTTHATTVSDQLGGSHLGVAGLRGHPVGILYPQRRADFHPETEVEMAGLPLPNGRIQCGTCHDAHNTHGYEGMLKISNERSRVCLACHRR